MTTFPTLVTTDAGGYPTPDFPIIAQFTFDEQVSMASATCATHLVCGRPLMYCECTERDCRDFNSTRDSALTRHSTVSPVYYDADYDTSAL